MFVLGAEVLNPKRIIFHILRGSFFLRRIHMPGAWSTEYTSIQLYYTSLSAIKCKPHGYIDYTCYMANIFFHNMT